MKPKLNINYGRLKNICNQPVNYFEQFGDVAETRDGIYVYRENQESKILGVAHLDSVLGSKHFHRIDIGGDPIVFNPCLDDRLGVYTLLEILPQLGIKFDLLLTEGEESGRSTARHFTTGKDYNWIFSFDRRGEDVVMYQYDDSDIRADLKTAGFKAGRGSFSDIAFLEHLGVKGINVGTGYYEEHSIMHHANMTVLASQVLKFKKFYDLFKDKKMPYEDTGEGWGDVGTFNRGYWNQYYATPHQPTVIQAEVDPYTRCDMCGFDARTTVQQKGWTFCLSCAQWVQFCTVCQTPYYDDELIDGVCESCVEKHL